jgi:STAS-like domain of unknown function (DUF4325)
MPNESWRVSTASKSPRFDFTGIDWIGHGFADEIFRVYQNAHPEIKILVEGANPDVKAMIQRVKTGS